MRVFYYDIISLVIVMDDIVSKIAKLNIDLFGENPIINKINVGFTNTIYSVNNLYIIKICSNINNEDKFKKEIIFYKANKDNKLIPKLFVGSTSKAEVPYMYEILEKVEGTSLYNVWHTLNEEERENIVKKICDAMRLFHSIKGKFYNWFERTCDIFNKAYYTVKELGIFDIEEVKLIDNAYNNFHLYLDANEFVLIHNDLHFDNIIYNNGKIKLIDFERSIYAPSDFELDILYRMVRKPWKFASEEAEKYVRKEDYSNIMNYIKKYYPEIMNIPNLYIRLAIYDMVYFMKQLVEYPHIKELKEDILSAAKIVGDIDGIY